MQDASNRHFDMIRIDPFDHRKVLFVADIFGFGLEEGHFFSAASQGSATKVRVNDPFAVLAIKNVHPITPLLRILF